MSKASRLLEAVPREVPLFLVVHLLDVHDWTNVASRYASEAAGRKVPFREASVMPDVATRAYASTVRDTDRYLGVLLDAWSQTRGMENSLVVFFSDHGEHLPTDSSGDFGHGHSMNDVLLRVPLVVKYPESTGVAAGTSDAMVSLVDLAPTIMDLVGEAEDARQYDGRSLLSAQEDPSAAERPIFADYQLYGDEFGSVRLGSRKLVINLTQREEHWGDPGTLDSNDPELDYDERDREALRSAYREHVERSGRQTEDLRSSHTPDPDETLEQLRALGYLE